MENLFDNQKVSNFWEILLDFS